MQKEVFAELILRLGNLRGEGDNSDPNLILMEDVRNHIIRYSPTELGIDYSVNIYKNSIEVKLNSLENTLMNMECTIQKQEGRKEGGYQETDFWIVINVTAIIDDYEVTNEFKIEMITQGDTQFKGQM